MEEIIIYVSERLGIIPFLVGIIFIITSLILYSFPPKKINYLYGYRTPLSMKNQEVWNFSQKYSAVKMIQAGFFLLAASLLNVLFFIPEKISTIIGVILLIASCIFMFFSTEKAIKKNFQNK